MGANSAEQVLFRGEQEVVPDAIVNLKDIKPLNL